MEFKGEIVITDPCYISTVEDWGEGFDFIGGKIDPKFRFSKYLFNNTGLGDGEWSVFKVDNYDYDTKDKLKDLCIQGEGIDDLSSLTGDWQGSFTSDTGLMGIFYNKEVRRYDKEALTDLPLRCYTILRDFDGDIYFIKGEQENHFIGIGKTYSFYTV